MAISCDGNWDQLVQKSHPHGCMAVFYAPWHNPSVKLTKVADELAKQHSNITVFTVDVDAHRELCDKIEGGVNEVPQCFFLRPDGTVVEVVAGAYPPKVAEMLQKCSGMRFDSDIKPVATPASTGATQSAAASADLEVRLKELISFAPVMLFMKGAKKDPFCKFSKVAVAILNEYDVNYATFDIFQDDEVREGLKKLSNWPTYPQLYIDGELVGGVDIMKEMHEDGSLRDALPRRAAPVAAAASQESLLEDKLKQLIQRDPIMLFMKGSPDTPQCGFSSQIVAILNKVGVAFGHFDILTDNDVRQGLKTFSNWPTFPQLYAHGNLIGGLDIVKELVEADELLQELENGQ